VKPRGCQVKSETIFTCKSDTSDIMPLSVRVPRDSVTAVGPWTGRKTQASVLRSDAESLGKYSPASKDCSAVIFMPSKCR